MPNDLAPGDQENAGSGNPTASPAPSKGSGAGDDGGGSDWRAGLSAENAALAQGKGWDTLDAALSSYAALEKQFSGRPSDKAPKSYTGSDYIFQPPDNAQAIGYDDNLANGFRALAVEKGIAPDVAKSVHDWFVGAMGKGVSEASAAQEAARAAAMSDAASALEKAWGNQDTTAFKRSIVLAERAAKQLGIMDDLTQAGVFYDDGKARHVTNPRVVQALAKIGNAMFAEDSLFGQDVAAGNPFDPSSPNYHSKLQSDLVRNDPEKAELFIRALKPADQRMWAHFLNNRKRT